MELYILDSLFRRIHVFDMFESLIWTERFSAAGEFQLKIPATVDARRYLRSGTRVAINQSTRMMTIETVTDEFDNSGRTILTVKGPSLEDILKDRTARGSLNNLTAEPKWTITGVPADIARYIFRKICMEGILNAGDIIPYLTSSELVYPLGTIPEPSSNIQVDLEPQSVYDAIKSICDSYDMGFRLVRVGDKTKLNFDIYTGNDKTSLQSNFPAVIFSPQLDNIEDVRSAVTATEFKNVAHVLSKNGSVIVYGNGADSTVSGFDRRVLTLNVTDVDDALTGAALTAELQKRGLWALASQRVTAAVDGQISQYNQYQYEKDYTLGDLVEMRTEAGVSNKMRVTEQVFVADAEGERSYPTLAIDTYIASGTWSSPRYNKPWNAATEFWIDA